jgi:hypothetical protein
MLILVFCQRLGASLWMHHLYHDARVSQHDKAGTPRWETRCDCFDDAFMPMEGASEFVLVKPAQQQVSLATPYLPVVPHLAIPHASLRGPPASSLLA